MPPRKKELSYINKVKVLVSMPPGEDLEYVPATHTIRKMFQEILGPPNPIDVVCSGVVINGQLVENDATLEGLGLLDNDPRSMCVVRINVEEKRRSADGSPYSELVPAQIGGLLPNEYPSLCRSEDVSYLSRCGGILKGDSLIPDYTYNMIGCGEGILVHGERLFHLTHEAQERCSNQLKTLLKKFPQGLGRATQGSVNLPVKMPDFTEIIQKLKNPRHYKHAFQFRDEILSIVQKYHTLALHLLGQVPKSEEEGERIEDEYVKMQNVLNAFFEPGVLERLENGQLRLDWPGLDDCCRHEDRHTPGSDDNVYYVGPVRDRSDPTDPKKPKSRLGWAGSNEQQVDSLVVKFQGVTPATTVMSLVQCYMVSAGNTRLKITHLKYADRLFDLNTLIHDVIKNPADLGLNKYYFTYVEHAEMDVEDLVKLIEGEDGKMSPKSSRKKTAKKNKQRKSKAEANARRQRKSESQDGDTDHSVSPDPKKNKQRKSKAEAEARRQSKSESQDEDTDRSASPDPDSLSLLGAHGGTEEEDSDYFVDDHMDELAAVEKQLIKEEAKREVLMRRKEKEEKLREEDEKKREELVRREDRNKIMQQLGRVMMQAKEMEQRMMREDADDEGITLADVLKTEEKPQGENFKVNGNKEETKVEEVKVNGNEEKLKVEEVEVNGSEAMPVLDERKARILKALEAKKTEATEVRESFQKMIEEKGREMSNLIADADEIEDNQTRMRKTAAKIDGDIEQLEKKIENMRLQKTSILSKCEIEDQNLNKIEKKKRKLESFLETFKGTTTAALSKIQGEEKELQNKLSNNEESTTTQVKQDGASSGNPQLLRFMERQIEALEKELECPICFEIAISPIFKCEDDHLICSGCRVKVRSCPQCRVEFTQGPHKRFRGAERQREKLESLYTERKHLMVGVFLQCLEKPKK